MLSYSPRSSNLADNGSDIRPSRSSLCEVPRVITRTVPVMDTEIFYEESGKGRPLVLLHGLSDSHRTWRHVVAKLAQHRRVITPDLPGCGLSGRPDASYSLDWQAKVMAAWLEALDLHDIDMVGHSYGGGVAQYMLLLQPQRIRRLALVAAGGLGREVALELRLASLPRIVEHFGQPFMAHVAAPALRAVGGVVGADEVAWLREVNARPGSARAFARTVRDVINWHGQTRHFLDRASEISALPPTALFWGTNDRVIPYAQAIETTRLLEGASLTPFAGCGHFPHQECPERFVDAIRSFLDDTSVRPVHVNTGENETRLSVEVGVRARLGVKLLLVPFALVGRPLAMVRRPIAAARRRLSTGFSRAFAFAFPRSLRLGKRAP